MKSAEQSSSAFAWHLGWGAGNSLVRIMFLRRFFVGFSLLAFAAQQAAAQTAVFLPSVRSTIEFGGGPTASRFSAQLSLTSLVLDDAPEANALVTSPQALPFLNLDVSDRAGKSILLVGEPVAVWDQPRSDRGALNQNGQTSSSWFGRNWWMVGLGVLAVGAVAIAAGGSGADKDSTDNPTNPSGCTAGSGNVGPVESPGIPVSCAP